MESRGKAGLFRQTRVIFYLLAGIPMLLSLSTAHAWEVKSYYPTGLTPTLPDAEEAQRLISQPPRLLNTIRQAHRQSLQTGWKGVAPPRPTLYSASAPNSTGGP